MYEQSIKWWDSLSEGQKLRLINKWKKIPGNTHYGHYKEWDNKMIMITPAVFDMIRKDMILNKTPK